MGVHARGEGGPLLATRAEEFRMGFRTFYGCGGEASGACWGGARENDRGCARIDAGTGDPSHGGTPARLPPVTDWGVVRLEE